MKTIYITPIPKPRMTQSDRWKKRKCVVNYWDYKDEIRIALKDYEFPCCNYHVIFYLPMPKSWSKKKKEEMIGKPHQQRPDKDNLEKALLDAIFEEDSHIWDGRASKVWNDIGKITITNYASTAPCFII